MRTAYHTNSHIPYWNELMSLSNEDKMRVIASLSASMVKDEVFDFDKEWKEALGVEDFRAECKNRLKKVYG